MTSRWLSRSLHSLWLFLSIAVVINKTLSFLSTQTRCSLIRLKESMYYCFQANKSFVTTIIKDNFNCSSNRGICQAPDSQHHYYTPKVKARRYQKKASSQRIQHFYIQNYLKEHLFSVSPWWALWGLRSLYVYAKVLKWCEPCGTSWGRQLKVPPNADQVTRALHLIGPSLHTWLHLPHCCLLLALWSSAIPPVRSVSMIPFGACFIPCIIRVAHHLFITMIFTLTGKLRWSLDVAPCFEISMLKYSVYTE